MGEYRSDPITNPNRQQQTWLSLQKHSSSTRMPRTKISEQNFERVEILLINFERLKHVHIANKPLLNLDELENCLNHQPINPSSRKPFGLEYKHAMRMKMTSSDYL